MRTFTLRPGRPVSPLRENDTPGTMAIYHLSAKIVSAPPAAPSSALQHTRIALRPTHRANLRLHVTPARTLTAAEGLWQRADLVAQRLAAEREHERSQKTLEQQQRGRQKDKTLEQDITGQRKVDRDYELEF
jgi:hypothetical protein